jgi:hypothetical protein
VTDGQEPERKLRRARELVANRRLELGARLEVLQVVVAVALDLLERFAGAGELPEREPEQRFVAGDLHLRRLGKPLVQQIEALLRDRVDLAVGLASLALGLPDGEAFGRKLLENRVDLPVALVPEVREQAADELLEVVARAGAEREQPEDGEFALVRFQFEPRPVTTL